MELKQVISQVINEKQDVFTQVSGAIWGFAETRYDLPQSADALISVLKDEGFTIKRGVAGMADAFIASYGSGKPVIGLLGEYDALPQMKQVADALMKTTDDVSAAGHGCGHNLLGTGAMAAAVAVKEAIRQAGIKGTIKFYGCPAEENGSGKAFMARDKIFEEADGLITWHPMTETGIFGMSTLANYRATVTFKGVSSHAAAAPEQGRSALDGAELMNIGINYLREHVKSDTRIHYAYLDTGGPFPNVVQSTAKLLYYVRSPRLVDAKEIFKRVEDIAKGAALMSGTKVDIQIESASAEYLVNEPLATALYSNMQKLGNIGFDELDLAYAQSYVAGLDEHSVTAYRVKMKKWLKDKPADIRDAVLTSPLNDELLPFELSDIPLSASTDVGDASWQAPTVQLLAACYPIGTVPHTWQWVATGKSAVAHKGMLYAAKVMGMTALDMLTSPELLAAAREDFLNRLDGNVYESVIPEDKMPV